MAVAVYEVTRQNFQSADLDWFTKLDNMCIGVRHGDISREQMKAHRFDRRQIAHRPIRYATHAMERLSNRRMYLTHQCAYARHSVAVLQHHHPRFRYRGDVMQKSDSVVIRVPGDRGR